MAYINTDVIACLKKQLCELECNPDKISGMKARFLRRIISQIEGYKTADVVEVKHGEWGEDGIAYVCNLCGESLVIEQGTADMNYCPECGAKMDGGKEE